MIKTANFIMSNSDYRKCPADGRPEFAFIGRSNVGKSSLINMLCGINGLAKTSSKPGKTQLINHFNINNDWYLVDLPGYGYAKVSKSEKAKFGAIITSYIKGRESLTCLFVLLDSRLEPQKIDLDFIHFLGEEGVPFALIYTKCDKPKESEFVKNRQLLEEKLSEEWEELPQIFVTSSHNSTGKDAVIDYLERTVKKLR
jgi:GTP-binding protein